MREKVVILKMLIQQPMIHLAITTDRQHSNRNTNCVNVHHMQCISYQALF